MHIKVIKGRKYWYTSKRVGEKVTSVYLGPVEEDTTSLEGPVQEPSEEDEQELEIQEEETEEDSEETFYVG